MSDEAQQLAFICATILLVVALAGACMTRNNRQIVECVKAGQSAVDCGRALD